MLTEYTHESNSTLQYFRHAQTRQAILQNARQMIVEDWIDGLSIRILADSINFAPGALYKYFKFKEDLIDAVQADCSDRLNIFIAGRVTSVENGAEMLLQNGMAYIEYAGRHPQENHLVFNMEPWRLTSGEGCRTAVRSLLEIIQR